MSGLIGTVVDAAIGCLVQSILGSLFTEQMVAWTREIGLAEDVEKLEREMVNVEMVLAAAEGRKIESMPLAKSLGHLKELLDDSEDMMDELDYYRLQQQIKEGTDCSANPKGSYESLSTPVSAFQFIYKATSQINSWVWALCGRKRKREEDGPVNSAMLPFEINRKRKREEEMLPFEVKHDISKKINAIVDKLHTIGRSVQRILQLEIPRPTATSSKSHNIAKNARMTTSFPSESKVYGRDAQRDQIVELLLNGESGDLNVLPLVGPIGGIGKTTLARFVYRDERVRHHFDLRMWVCVSTDFSEWRLTLEILEHACEDRQDYKKISSLNVLKEILLRYIRNRRFLLVLDDMWEDKDMSGWINFLAPLRCNQATGCMIVATTRRKSVAKMIGTMVEIEVNGLDANEFWLFFRACAFGNENYEGDPSLESIGKEIAESLKGCPLAARSVGALLNTDRSYQHWMKVRDKWKSLEDADDILSILKLSYDYLPVHLQRCFSYCSLFPEDHPFNGENLVHAWVSQNFVQCEDPTMRLEETGQQYLDRLVDLGFFQKDGSHYVMHDLMHVLARKVSSNECATINGLKPEAIRPNVRHLSIIITDFDKDEHHNSPGEKFEQILQKVRPLRKLRTLMLFGQRTTHLLGSIHNLCKEAECLRFLRICVAGADMSCINSLSNPRHLRYLEYVCAVTTDVPLYGVYNNTAFPQDLTKFYHLQVFHLEGCRESQFLSTLEMPSLKKLTLIRMLNLMEISVSSLEELILINMPKLEKCIGSYRMELTSCLRVLMIKSCPQLNEFTLFQSYSSFDAEQKSWFPCLSKLSIGQCPRILNNWPILPLREMGALKELELMNLHVVRVSVPSLEKLVLTKMPSLEFCSSLTTQGDQMGWPSSLRRLTIHDCPCLIVPHPLPPSALISQMSIRGVPGLAKMSIDHRWFTIESNELNVLDDSILAFSNLGGIRLFQIYNCPNLISLSSESFSQLIALETLYMRDCPNLTMSNIMPEIVQENSTSASSLVPPSLKSVSIWSCGVTGRWLSQLLSHSQSLEEFLLTGCLQVKFLSISQPTETEGTNSLASAVMISAQDEQELKLPYNLPRSLKKLRIQLNLDLEFCGGSRDFTGFTSLTELVLCGCPKLVSSLMCETKDDGTMEVGLLPPALEEVTISSLPESLQSFTPQGLLHLKKLRLSYGPCLKSVQLHSCTSLVELEITGCVQLAVLEGLQFLTSLRSLDIEMSPELSSAWDLKLQEQEQGGNQIQLFPPSLDKLEITAVTDRAQSHLLSCFPAITKLAIQRSPELTFLQLAYCTALKELEIGDCDLLASIEGLQFCRNLTSLKVFNSPSLPSCLELLSHQQGVCEVWSGLKTLVASDASILSRPFCKQFTSLTHLGFSSQGREQRESLVSLTGEQERALQLLTSLQELKFSWYTNLLSLPANLHSLTSLERLSIYGCQSITRLPDMGLPTSLRSLELLNCSEELAMQCRIAATEKLRVRIDNQDVN